MVKGEVQEAKAPPSMLHSKREPASPENTNVGDLSVLGSVGPESIAVLGGAVSTVNAR